MPRLPGTSPHKVAVRTLVPRLPRMVVRILRIIIIIISLLLRRVCRMLMLYFRPLPVLQRARQASAAVAAPAEGWSNDGLREKLEVAGAVLI